MTKLVGIALWAAVVVGAVVVDAQDVRAADPCRGGTVPGAKGECISCPAGSFAAAGATGCSPCAAGTYSGVGASVCIVCPVGSTSKLGSASCTPIPAK
jgi:hypothetical protein